MGTVPERELTPQDEAPTRVEEAFRLAVAGHPRGAMRRIILYIIVALALGAEFAWAGPSALIAVASVGMIALLLLAMSDQLA